jgi:hypothetical protein
MGTTLKFIKSSSGFLLLVALAASCVQSEYTSLVKKELASGVRQDSLIFGIRFGDTRNDFFGKCFDLNQQQLITQGPNGTSVQYLFKDSLVHQRATRLRLLFYPTFDENEKIAEMKMEFSYQGWAPWNRELQSDSLKIKVIDMLSSWYGGNQFINVKLGETDVPIKVDGNRRILIDVKDAQSVRVMVQDLLHPMFQHSITAESSKEAEQK